VAITVTQNGKTFRIPEKGDTDWGTDFTRWVQETNASIVSGGGGGGGGVVTPGINVQDYGATGDGSTDDTLKIRDAMAALALLGTTGGVLYFPAGTYKVTSTLQFGVSAPQANITLMGEGTSSKIVQSGNFSSTPLVELRDCDFWAVDSLWLDGSAASGTNDLLLVDGSSNGALSSTKLTGARRYGVQLAQVNGASVPVNNTTWDNVYASNTTGNIYYAPAGAILQSDDGLDMLAGAAPFSLKRFGAKGDGTDESAYFAKAEAAAYAAGGQVYVPPGTFTVINLSTRVGVVGPGTLKLKSQSNSNPATALYPLLRIIADSVTLSGVTFDGNMANQRILLQDSDAGRKKAALVALSTCNDIRVQGCHFKNFRHDAIANYSTGAENSTDCNVNGLVVTGCTFRNGISGAIEFFGVPPAPGTTTMTSGGLVVAGNHFENIGGVDPLSPTYTQVSGADDPHTYGDVITGGWLKSAVVTGNVFQTNKRASVKLGVVVDLVIDANAFRETFWNAVQVAAACPGATWRGSTFYAAGSTIVWNSHIYTTSAGGTTHANDVSVPPSHTSGTVTDGAVLWTYMGEGAVDYEGAISISNNVFTDCAPGSSADPNIGGAIDINGSALEIWWKSGACRIVGNTITRSPASGSFGAHDAIVVAGAAHYRTYDISGNVIRHFSRHGIAFECFDVPYKETVRICNNLVDCTNSTTTAGCVYVFSATSMTSANRLLQLDVSSNTCAGANHGIWIQYDPARNLVIADNKIRTSAQEAVYWLETSTPLSCFVDGNVVTEFTNAQFMTLNAANVRVGRRNQCSTSGSYVKVAGPSPTGFGFSNNAPLGWFLQGDVWQRSDTTVGNNAAWTCTSAGFSTPTKWVPGASYSANGVVYCHNGGNAYTATIAGAPVTGGTTPPTHGAGSVTDGVVTWAFLGVHAGMAPTSQVGPAADIGDALPVGVSAPYALGSQIKLTVDYKAFTTAATTQNLTLFALPAKTRVCKAVVEVTTGFAGVASLTVSLGTNATTYNNLILAFDPSSTAQKGLLDADMGTALTRAAAIQGGYLPSWSGTTNLNLQLIGAANLGTGTVTNLTAGSINVYLTVEKYA
jgi:hypothetical protein